MVGKWAMDGMAIFPLLVLTCDLFSDKILAALLHASRPTLAIAGFFALMAVLTVDQREDIA